MIVGALLDLGVDTAKFSETMKTVGQHVKGCSRLEIEVDEVTRRGLRAKKLSVRAVEHATYRAGVELRDAVANCVGEIGLSDGARRLAMNAIDLLISAEAKVHGESLGEAHLHEAGSVDTVVDIVGAAVALEELSLLGDTKIYSMPVAVGGGLFRFSHGTFSSPAPATIEILRSRGFPMVGGPIDFELATPTGVALLVSMAEEASSFYPAMRPDVVGYGAGAETSRTSQTSYG